MATNELFDAFGTGSKVAARSKKRKKAFDDELSLSDLPPLTPEQEQGLISRALGGGVSGLQWIGETLDKPRRALYGALAGSREALNFIPFSDTMGLTDPAETITGRDALEAAGILGKNTDGLDFGDVAGFLFELPTDPANFVSLGAKSAVGGAIKAGTSAASKLDDIAKGATSIARITTPDIGIPFTKIKTNPRTLELFGKPLEWTGDSAAKFYDRLNYGEYSPVPYIRKVFSGNEHIVNAPVGYQKDIDLKTDAVQSATEASSGDIMELFRLKDKARKSTEQLRTDQIIGTDPIQVRSAKAKVVSNIAAVDPEFKSVVDNRLKPFNLSDDFGNTAPSATAAKAEESLASLYDEAMDIKNGYGKIGEKLGNELVRLREEIAQGAANAPAGEQGWWNDLLADLSETKTPGLPYYSELLKGLGYSDSLDSFTATTKAYDEFVGFVRKKYDEFEGKMRELGIDMGRYENPFVAYSHRSATKQYAKDASMIDASRSGIVGKMKRSVVNAVAKQLAGLRRDKTKAQQWVESLDQDTLDALKTERIPAKNHYAYPLYEAAKKAGVNWKDALDFAQSKRAAERETLQWMRDTVFSTAEEYLGPNWQSIIRKSTKGSFDATSIPSLPEIIRSVALKRGMEGVTDSTFAQEIFDQLSHPNPIGRYAPRKLADKTLIDEAVEAARKNQEARNAAKIDPLDDFNPASFDAAAAPKSGAKFSTELVAEFLKRNGVPWNGDFNANMRKAIAEHPDQDFAALAQRGDIDDETFAAILKETADAKGYTTNMKDVNTPDDLLEYMHMHDPAVKNAGGYSQQEINDLAKWFTDLPDGVRETGFFDRDVVMDIADYYQQANRKIAQASILRSFFKDTRFVGPLGKDGNDLSIYDTWKGAGMTDEGLLTLMAERRGQDYKTIVASKTIDEKNAYIKGLYDEARATGMPSSLARGLVNTGRVFAGKNEPSWLGKLTDRFRSILQASLYTPWLASHNRNHIGGVALNAIAGVFDVQSYADAYKLFRGKNLDDDFIREALKQAIATGIMKSSHPSGFTSQEMLEELMRAIENPNSQIAGKGLLATMADPIKTMMGQVKETYQAQGLRKAAKQALFGGELPSGGSATGLLNFWEVRGGLSPGDAKRNMGAVDANGKLLDTLDRWKSQETRILPMQIGEQLSAYVEFQNRMQPFLYLLRKGWNPHAAALKVKELHFDYGSLNSFEKKVLKRNILFYCVPEHSEILTRDGWKRHEELCVGEEVLTYNQETDQAEWQPCKAKNVFEHDQELIVAENSRAKLEFTDDHRWIVETLPCTVKRPYGEYHYPAKRMAVLGKNLKSGQRIITAARLKSTEESLLTPKQARLLGWLITDGHVSYKGNHVSGVIYQSPKKFLAEVCEVAEGAVYKAHPDTGVHAVKVKNHLMKELKPYLDKSKLSSVVTRLSTDAMVAMYNAMYMADGCISEKRNSDFLAAQNEGVREAFRILATLLGKRTSVQDRGCLIHQRRAMKVSDLKISRRHYRGKVWCPTTDNGTWVMRQNGIVTITGNSFMRKNLELQAKLLFHNPGGTTSKIVRAENRLQDESKGPDGFIPSHLREGFTVRLPGEVEGYPGTAKFWNQSGLLPIEEAAGRWQFDREGFPLSIRRTAEKFAAQLAPWFSAPIEQFSGRQLSTGRPLKDLYQYPTGDVETDFWISKSPASRLISTIRTLADDRKTVGQKLFNTTVGGARVTDVNVPMTRLLEGRRAVQESLSADPDIGQYEALYARDLSSLVERAKNGDDTALAQLQLYQQLRNEIRKMRKDAKK